MPLSISGPELAKLSPDLISRLGGALQRLSQADSSLWGASAEEEAKIRLGWLHASTHSRKLLPALQSLPSHRKIVLCGMGGSSLAPEVIAATYGRDLTILDSTDPAQVQGALASPSDTTFLIASKSGSTIETDSQRRAVEKALDDHGLPRDQHIVVVTDPQSPLDRYSREQGYSVVNADPHVGGRFSALTAFGVTPAFLISADVEQLLTDADLATAEMINDPSPAVLLAAAIVRHNSISPYITIASGSHIPGFGDWVEQLVAESTGKDGRGTLPIVVEGVDSPDFTGPDRLSISLVPDARADLVIEGNLGAQFVLWEWATALIGFALEIDPFNQPNVTESKTITGAILEEGLPIQKPLLSEYGADLFTDMDVQSLEDLFEQLRHHAGYLAIMAYLDRNSDSQAVQLRKAFAPYVPTTFGWGPRFLHSTGQFHKGGPLIGAFLQITADSKVDLAIPGKNFTFSQLNMAQALGDYRALSSRGLPIARIHLHDRNSISTLVRLANAG